MKKKKIRIGIIFGGKSAEHEVSLQSAKSVAGALDKNKYEVFYIGITKDGRWHLFPSHNYLESPHNSKRIKLSSSKKQLRLTPGALLTQNLSQVHKNVPLGLDVLFPVLHGTYGEDGTVQGLLEILDMPYVGAGVLPSAIGMDKDVMKRLLRAGNIPVAKFLVFHRGEAMSSDFIARSLGFPLFVKPANAGSSVGISKVKHKKDLEGAFKKAFLYDDKLLIEGFIKGREIEVSVLGNEKPKASVPGEIIPNHEFYSYEAKYIDPNGATLMVPAKLTKDQIKKAQGLALRSYKALCLEGMARVDMFLTSKGFVISEVNTIPGFTNISMYPKLWEASGLPYTKLLDNLILLAMDRKAKKRKLRTSF